MTWTWRGHSSRLSWKTHLLHCIDCTLEIFYPRDCSQPPTEKEKWNGWDSESSFRAANERKLERYSRLAEDLREAGFTTTVMPLELGCRGVLDRSNAANLEVLLNQLGIRSFKKVRSELGKLALLGSYRIWLARQSAIWTPGPLLRVGGCTSPASSSAPSPSASPPPSSSPPSPRASPPPPTSSASAPTPSPPSLRPSFCSPS